MRVTGIAGAAAGVWIAGRCKASVGKAGGIRSDDVTTTVVVGVLSAGGSAGGIRSDDVTTTVVVGATVVAGEAFDADENVSNVTDSAAVRAIGARRERFIEVILRVVVCGLLGLPELLLGSGLRVVAKHR